MDAKQQQQQQQLENGPAPASLAPALDLWCTADAVCFDVDSTVSPVEGIDVLAHHCGCGEQVAEVTRQAMDGGLPFARALADRLALIRPSRDTLAACIAAHPPALTPGIGELVTKLCSRGVAVYLVSGGIRQMVSPLASLLNIPDERVFANVAAFDEQGRFLSIDAHQLTAQTGGKAKVIANLIRQYGYRRVVMVGDGITDLHARPPASLFIAYGGVVERPSVRAASDWFVKSFDELRLPLMRTARTAVVEKEKSSKPQDASCGLVG
jgi:phosphoserine phosphatase